MFAMLFGGREGVRPELIEYGYRVDSGSVRRATWRWL